MDLLSSYSHQSETTMTLTQSQNYTPTLGTDQTELMTNETSRDFDLQALPTADAQRSENSEADEEIDRVPTNSTNSSQNDNMTTLEAILRQMNTNDANEWMRTLVEKVTARFNRIPRGGWQRITSTFNEQLGLSKRQIDIKNLYNRMKNERLGQRMQGQNELGGYEPEEVTQAIKNVALYEQIKHTLLANVDKYVYKKEMKVRTRKIPRDSVNQEVLRLMNIAAQRELELENVTSLGGINDVFLRMPKNI